MHGGITRARLFLLRHPWVYWAGAALSCAVVVAGIGAQIRAVDAERRAWGDTAEVWMVVDDGEAGEHPSIERRDVPLALVPDAAVHTGSTPPTLRRRVRAGTILVDVDVVDQRGPGALAEPGTVVVAVDDPLVGDVEVGAAAAVYADGVVLADEAVVVGVDAGAVLVAVDERHAPAVAGAARLGTASLGFPGR